MACLSNGRKPSVEPIAVHQGWLVLCILMVVFMPCRASVVAKLSCDRQTPRQTAKAWLEQVITLEL